MPPRVEIKARGRASGVLSREVGFIRKPHGGKLRVALAFPNTYFVGMSNLGFQTVYRLFNELEDVVCERVCLPPKQELQAQLASGTPLRTIESETPVRDFDVRLTAPHRLPPTRIGAAAADWKPPARICSAAGPPSAR